MSSELQPIASSSTKQNAYKDLSEQLVPIDINAITTNMRRRKPPSQTKTKAKRSNKHAQAQQQLQSPQAQTKHRKQAIPAALKSAIWLAYNGKSFEAKCHVTWCQTIINVFNYEAGHDIPESKGGPTTLDNLRPICALCNRSMGNIYSISEFSTKFNRKASRQQAQRAAFGLGRFSFLRSLFACWTQPKPSKIQPLQQDP